MKFFKILGLIVVVLGVFGVGMYAYLGGFSTVTVSKGNFKSTEIVYATHKGAYKNLSKSWSAFQKKWEEAGLKSCDSLAVYFDPPGTPEEKLRSIIGCRIDGLSEEARENIREKLPHFRLPKSKALVARFPYKNVASFFIGPMKVYPEMKKVMTAEKLPGSVAIETYGTTSSIKDMGYFMPNETRPGDYQELLDAFAD